MRQLYGDFLLDTHGHGSGDNRLGYEHAALRLLSRKRRLNVGLNEFVIVHRFPIIRSRTSVRVAHASSAQRMLEGRAHESISIA